MGSQRVRHDWAQHNKPNISKAPAVLGSCEATLAAALKVPRLPRHGQKTGTNRRTQTGCRGRRVRGLRQGQQQKKLTGWAMESKGVRWAQAFGEQMQAVLTDWQQDRQDKSYMMALFQSGHSCVTVWGCGHREGNWTGKKDGGERHEVKQLTVSEIWTEFLQWRCNWGR